MDIGWSHYAFIFIGHHRSGFVAYFVACVCSFRLILQMIGSKAFTVSAWIVMVLLFMLASALAQSDPIMA